MPAIRCTDMGKEYHSQKVVRALDRVNLEVEEGEVFGLLGPNGAGKTTLVRILATLLRATDGQAQVCGYDVARDERAVRHVIGYAGQDSERSAYSRLTVQENLIYFAHALRLFGMVALPMTPGIDLLRHYVMGTVTLYAVPSEWVVLAGQFVIFSLIARVTVVWLERSAREQGLHYI